MHAAHAWWTQTNADQAENSFLPHLSKAKMRLRRCVGTMSLKIGLLQAAQQDKRQRLLATVLNRCRKASVFASKQATHRDASDASLPPYLFLPM